MSRRRVDRSSSYTASYGTDVLPVMTEPSKHRKSSKGRKSANVHAVNLSNARITGVIPESTLLQLLQSEKRLSDGGRVKRRAGTANSSSMTTGATVALRPSRHLHSMVGEASNDDEEMARAKRYLDMAREHLSHEEDEEAVQIAIGNALAVVNRAKGHHTHAHSSPDHHHHQQQLKGAGVRRTQSTMSESYEVHSSSHANKRRIAAQEVELMRREVEELRLELQSTKTELTSREEDLERSQNEARRQQHEQTLEMTQLAEQRERERLEKLQEELETMRKAWGLTYDRLEGTERALELLQRKTDTDDSKMRELEEKTMRAELELERTGQELERQRELRERERREREERERKRAEAEKKSLMQQQRSEETNGSKKSSDSLAEIEARILKAVQREHDATAPQGAKGKLVRERQDDDDMYLTREELIARRVESELRRRMEAEVREQVLAELERAPKTVDTQTDASDVTPQHTLKRNKSVQRERTEVKVGDECGDGSRVVSVSGASPTYAPGTRRTHKVTRRRRHHSTLGSQDSAEMGGEEAMQQHYDEGGARGARASSSMSMTNMADVDPQVDSALAGLRSELSRVQAHQQALQISRHQGALFAASSASNGATPRGSPMPMRASPAQLRSASTASFGPPQAVTDATAGEEYRRSVITRQRSLQSLVGTGTGTGSAAMAIELNRRAGGRTSPVRSTSHAVSSQAQQVPLQQRLEAMSHDADVLRQRALQLQPADEWERMLALLAELRKVLVKLPPMIRNRTWLAVATRHVATASSTLADLMQRFPAYLAQSSDRTTADTFLANGQAFRTNVERVTTGQAVSESQMLRSISDAQESTSAMHQVVAGARHRQQPISPYASSSTAVVPPVITTAPTPEPTSVN